MSEASLDANKYGGTTDAAELRARAASAARRLGLEHAGAVKLRPFVEGGAELTLAFDAGAAPVVRRCESQPTRGANFGALVQWLEDLARNAERGIETIGEALRGDGVSLVPRGSAPTQRSLARNDYAGDLEPADAWALVQRSLERLRLDPSSAWMGREGEGALLRIGFDAGRTIEKRSSHQRDSRRNAAALALWLSGRARHHERGIESDLARSFAAYLVAGGKNGG